MSKLSKEFITTLLALNKVEEGKARMGEEGCDEKVASSKRKTKLKTRVQKLIPYLRPKWWQNG